jgi:heat shock protein HslJ
MKTKDPHTVRRLMRAFATICLFATLAPAASQAEDASGTPASRAQLVATPVWQLTRMGDQPAIGAVRSTITFDKNGSLSGHGGVNRLGGSYTVNAEGGVTIGELIHTEMASTDPEIQRQEVEYLRQLAHAKQARMSEGNLILLCQEGDGKSVRLVFAPTPTE